jgi:hypothetical protein
MAEHYDQREALHAVKQSVDVAGAKEAKTCCMWLIQPDMFAPWESVILVELEEDEDSNWWWDMKRGVCYFKGDVFTSELGARKELEKRLYDLSESLRKHREAMTKALVNCAEGDNP